MLIDNFNQHLSPFIFHMDPLLDDFRESGPSGEPTEYAPFLVRTAAYLLDLLIVGIPINLFLSRFHGWPFELGFMPSMGSAVALWLYFAILESSWRQATIGKSIMHLKVTDQEGRRISFLRATGRHLGKVLSSAIFAIGYFMAAFTERKQALHDMVAGTLVVKRGQDVQD